MKNRGFTLIESLIVIVVIGIIAGFATITVSNIVTNTRIKVDSRNLDTLNSITEDYAYFHNVTSSDIFSGVSNNDNRMLLLVEEGALSSMIRPQQNGASFEWNIEQQTWELIGGDYTSQSGISSGSIAFATKTTSDLEDLGVVSINLSKWDTSGSGLENTTGETRIFIPIQSNTYTITVSATLSEGTAGGYGIFFDTTLRNDDVSRDDGYVFQFDRGYANGAMIVRPRVNGSEKSPVFTVRENQTDVFPSKVVDPDWWTDTHTIKIVVVNLNESTRKATFYIDGQNIGSYTYNNDLDGGQVYTGFRGWGSSPTVFHSISVN